MKTLHLNLKKQWFDMIASGEKKEEYREIKPYWENRFTCSWSSYESHGVKSSIYDNLYPDMSYNSFGYDTITFSNGYSKNRPQFEIELKSIKIKEGKNEWGALSGQKYFVLELGEIIN